MFNEQDYLLLKNWLAIDKIVAIFYYGRSGSVFLQSLLDGHPEIIMIPGTYLMHYHDFWKEFGSFSKKNIIDKFCDYFSPLFDVNSDAKMGAWKKPAIKLSFDKMGEERTEKIEVDRKFFKETASYLLSDFEKVDRRTFFQAVHVSYTIVTGRSNQLAKEKIPIIIYQLHTPLLSRVNSLLEDFVKVQAVHMIREPLQTLGSHFRHSGYDCYKLYESFKMGFPILDSSCSKAIKLEELHKNPRSILEKLSNWLGINWDDSLLCSTFNGIKWWNVSDVEQLSGFNSKIISKKHDDLYFKFDIFRLKILYCKRLKLWGYSSRSVSKLKRIFIFPLLFFPFKMEIIHWKKYLILKGRKEGGRNIFDDFFYKNEKRKELFRAWKYSINEKIEEVDLL